MFFSVLGWAFQFSVNMQQLVVYHGRMHSQCKHTALHLIFHHLSITEKVPMLYILYLSHFICFVYLHHVQI